MLPVEFARISENGRLTLVVLPGYENQCKVLWITSQHHSVESAISNLAAQEGINPEHATGSIHGVLATGERLGNVLNEVAAPVCAWMNSVPNLRASIWTGLGEGTRWQEHGYDGFTVANALDYLSGLQGEMRRSNAEYFTKAPRSIRTPVRQLAPF
jgi:hypothetical protein